MRRLLKSLIVTAVLLIPSLSFGQIYEPEGVNIPGEWTGGFANSNDPEVMGNFRMSKRAFGGGQYVTTLNIAASGGDTTAGTYAMLFTSGPDGNLFANKWAGATLNIDGFSGLTYNSGPDNSISVENGFYYTLVFKDNGYASSEAAVFKTSAVPVNIDTATGIPAEAVAENTPVTITVELDAPKSAEEKIYVRYSTDNFASSEAVEVTNFAGGTTGTVDIPGQAKNSVVDFYVLSTTIDKADWSGKADLATIDFQNNGGLNYSYFYEANIQPLNGAENVSRMPEIKWYQVENMTGYDFQLDDNSDFSTPIADEADLADTTFTPSQQLDIYTDYYWRFKADTATSWSRTFTFKTQPEVTFGNVQFPESAVLDEGNAATIYGHVFVPGITELSGASSDISAWVGINVTNENPGNWNEQSWGAASYNATSTTAGNNDEYQAEIGSSLSPGTYYYAYRYQYKDQGFEYGVLGGIWDDTTQTLGELVILDVPELNSPANSSEGVSLEPELTWTATDANIAQFNLQISDDATFASPVVDEQNLSTASTSYTVGSGLLDFENTYFWRVRSEYDTTASGWSETFSFTTLQNLPGAVTLNTPADAATDIGLTPDFSWTAESASTSYKVQVSRSSDFTQANSLIINSEGVADTQFSITDTTLLAAQTYYWRVQGVNSAGDGPWSATRSFTTATIIPTLLSPAEDATDIPTTASLLWNSIPGALHYDVQISKNSAFTGANIVVDVTAHPDTMFTAENLALNQSYYWRIRANYEGVSSDWSASRQFTVKDAPPLKPVLINPDSAAVNVALNVSLNWEMATDAESYQVQLSTVGDFSSNLLVDTSAVLTTSIDAPALNRETSYYWRVRGYNVSGGNGEWSATNVFTTIPNPPASVTLLAPDDSLTDLSVPITFSWDSVSGAASYEFQFSGDPAFSFTSDSVLSDTSLALSKFDAGSGYFWRVRAENAGGTSAWSAPNYFESGTGGFAGPELITPKHEEMNTGTELTFSWSALAGADDYQFQLSTSVAFDGFVIDTSGVQSANFSVSGLEKGLTYFWRVRGADSKSQSDWSAIYSFNTEAEAPGNVVLTAPADSTADVALPVTFSWNPAEGAGTYEFRLSEQADFGISIDSTVTDTSLTLSSLSYNTAYYWQVRGVNAAGVGSWSSVHYFTTTIQRPGVPELVNPEEGETVGRSVRFGWNEAANAESYEFQLAENENFDPLTADTSNIQTLTLQLENLDEATTYFWRVRGVNRAGEGAWSDTLSFTTEMLTSLADESMPDEFALYPNYPNPFNPTTTIQYDVKFAGPVKIEVFDISGRLIQTLVNKPQSSGRYKATFDAGSLASGLYLIRMEAPQFLQIRKMTLIK